MADGKSSFTALQSRRTTTITKKKAFANPKKPEVKPSGSMALKIVSQCIMLYFNTQVYCVKIDHKEVVNIVFSSVF